MIRAFNAFNTWTDAGAYRFLMIMLFGLVAFAAVLFTLLYTVIGTADQRHQRQCEEAAATRMLLPEYNGAKVIANPTVVQLGLGVMNPFQPRLDRCLCSNAA